MRADAVHELQRVGLTKDKAEELGVTTISDLSETAGDMTLYGSPECRQRTDCLLGLEQVYGLKFKKFVPVDIALRHEVLTSGKADVVDRVHHRPADQARGLVLLEDDKGCSRPTTRRWSSARRRRTRPPTCRTWSRRSRRG